MFSKPFAICVILGIASACWTQDVKTNGSQLFVSQDKVRDQIFSETDQLIAEARQKKEELYAPKNFARALESYQEAEEAYRKGKNLEEIRGKLRAVAGYLQQASDAMKLGEVTFVSVVAARNDGMSADAPRYAPDLWRKAEAQFKTAAEELEDGDVQDARKEGATAEGFYRNAELEAIKTNFLAPARELLQRAEAIDAKENAPKTFARAKMLAGKTESLLRQNRYDTDEARQLAQQSKYEAAHSIYLHETIQRMKKADQSFEDILLSAEEPLQKIAGTMDITSSFDRGFDPTTTSVITEIRNREAKDKQNLETIKQQQREIENLKQQVMSMEGRLGTLTDAEQKLKQNLVTQKNQEELFAQVASMISVDEGSVVREGKSIVLRMHGLVFPAAKSSIEPDQQPLMTKIASAIRVYPNCQLVVEGHTDSQGSDGANMALSEERAIVVAEYLKSMLGGKTSITTFGYGETKPVASNETIEGRAKNRRIDITIVPEWAIVGK